jgi:hypothetical protein
MVNPAALREVDASVAIEGKVVANFDLLDMPPTIPIIAATKATTGITAGSGSGGGVGILQSGGTSSSTTSSCATSNIAGTGSGIVSGNTINNNIDDVTPPGPFDSISEQPPLYDPYSDLYKNSGTAGGIGGIGGIGGRIGQQQQQSLFRIGFIPSTPPPMVA